MKAIVASIHGIMTGQTNPSWPDRFDAWMLRRDPEIKVLKREYVAGPFPHYNCYIRNPRLANALANELELFARQSSPCLLPAPRENSSKDFTPSSPPIWLLAHSNGAVIALLVTQRLIARGMQVGGLILIGAACEADVVRNRVSSWLADGSLRAAISYSSNEDEVLGSGPIDITGHSLLSRWLWRHMIAPYGTLGSSGWTLKGQPASNQRLVTRWHSEGHSGLFAPDRMERTFECIYQDISIFSKRALNDGPSRPEVSCLPALLATPLAMAQLPAPPPGAMESWLLSGAAVASLVLLLKKIWPRQNDANLVHRSEFQSLQITVESLRDKIDARSLAIGEKIDRLSESLHKRLNELEAGLARVDERTRGRQ